MSSLPAATVASGRERGAAAKSVEEAMATSATASHPEVMPAAATGSAGSLAIATEFLATMAQRDAAAWRRCLSGWRLPPRVFGTCGKRESEITSQDPTSEKDPISDASSKVFRCRLHRFPCAGFLPPTRFVRFLDAFREEGFPRLRVGTSATSSMSGSSSMAGNSVCGRAEAAGTAGISTTAVPMLMVWSETAGEKRPGRRGRV